MSNKNEVFEYLIYQLRQQVNNSRCEDLAHEVLSLKNQLRDASALVAEFHKDNIKKSEHISHLTGQVKDLTKRLANATGGITGHTDATEQSGCRKDDTQESCWVEWSGGYCPVPSGTLVDVIYRDGETIYGLPADELNDTERDASVCFWRHDGMPNDIVRYRKAVHQ